MPTIVDRPDAAVVIADGTDQHRIEMPETITFEVASESALPAGPPEPFAESLRSLRRTS